MTNFRLIKLLQEYREWLEVARKSVKPYDASWYIPMGMVEPYWVEIKRKQSQANKRAKELLKKYKKIDLVVKDFELRYIKLSDYQTRVKNPRTGKFIDWWKGRNQKMLNANGEYAYYTDEKSIVKQILKII